MVFDDFKSSEHLSDPETDTPYRLRIESLPFIENMRISLNFDITVAVFFSPQSLDLHYNPEISSGKTHQSAKT
jgi:hypothetical protein